MDQENYNDIDMEIEMDSNDIDVSAEMPNEIIVNNYNSLKNKPSINSVELVGNKTLEDLGITEYVEGEIANFDFIKIVPQLPEKGLINRTYFVPKTDPESNDLYEEYMWINNKWEMMGTKQIKVDLTDYVKNTDYAKADKGGTIKIGNGVSLKNGVIQTDSIDYNAYKDSPNEYFIGKGTLEKVIEGKELINKEYSNNIVEEQRLENERLRNDIKSIALPGEASGENIHIEDSSEARCEIEIDGNQKQNTREGYNQLKNEGTTQTLNNVTITKKEDETLVVNGTATEDFIFSIKKNIELEDGEQYKLSGCPNGGDEKKYALTINQYYENQSHFGQDYGNGVNFIYNGSLPINNNIYIRLFKGITYNNLIFKPMIVKGTEQKTYEQYGASPSIDYPSSVKAVGNIKNILDMSNAKNGSSAGIACTMNADGSYKYKGTATSQYINVWFMGGYAKDLPTLFTLEPGTYYINDVSLFEGTTGFANDSSKKIWTFIRAYNVTGVRAPNAVSGNTYDETKYPIIAKIDHEIPWVPYDCGFVQVNVQNKNYLANIAQSSVTENGITATYDGKKFLCKGTTTSGYFGVIKKTNIYLPIGTYTFSQNAISRGRFVLRLYYRDNTFSTHYISAATWRVSFTTSKEAVSFGIFCDSLSSGINIDYTVYVQLERGATNTDWIKPEIQQRIFPVQQEMLEGDTFIRQDGKWYEKHCWGKKALTGDENLVGYEYSKNSYKFYFTSKFLRNEVTVLSNCFFGVSYDDRTNASNNTIYSDGGAIYIRNTEFTDVETLKAKLKELYEARTPVIIYYRLAEPAMLECTEAQSKVLDEIYSKAHTYKNITNILAESSEVNPIINVKYLKDTEKYIEDKITTALTEINALNQVRTQMLDAEVEI